MTEALVEAGADVFVGYPITPANLLFHYGAARFPLTLPAPDEISAVQWMAGLSATGGLPVTATSFPGFALMIESINMAFMMELPMVFVLVQRLGPATGTATCGAQGDVLLLRGLISGGHPVPVLCVSNLRDCWSLSARAVSLAAELRTPVVLLTSKEKIMTLRSFPVDSLPPIEPVTRTVYRSEEQYRPKAAGEDLVPEFLPVGDDRHQVRVTASTHDADGLLQHSTAGALSNTRRLREKIIRHVSEYTEYQLDEMEGADTLIVSYGITATAVREATHRLRECGVAVSFLVAKTLLPIPPDYARIMDRYERVILAEENLGGQYCELLFGDRRPAGVSIVEALGDLIAPEQVMEAVRKA